MRRFPVGRILELSDLVKVRITFLAQILDHIDFVQRKLTEKFQNEPAAPEAVNEAMDKLFISSPFQTMVSVVLANGWNGPDAILHAQSSSNVIRKIIWSMIYADIVEAYDIGHQDWRKLKLSLLENPPGGGILVLGYEFKETDFGHRQAPGGKNDVCPDYPPASFIDDEDGNGDPG